MILEVYQSSLAELLSCTVSIYEKSVVFDSSNIRDFSSYLCSKKVQRCTVRRLQSNDGEL